MRTIIIFGCFLFVTGNAWAQLGKDIQQPPRQLQPNPPVYSYGHLAASSTSESLQGFNAWFQQQRKHNRQQHMRSQQKTRRYLYRQRPIPYTPKSLQGFDDWFQQQREQHRQQHMRVRQKAREHELDQMYRLREYDRLRKGPLQHY